MEKYMKKNSKKYVVWSGWVKNESDKDVFITAEKVMKLYGLTKDDCILCDVDNPRIYKDLDMNGKKALFPRQDGKYVLSIVN